MSPRKVSQGAASFLSIHRQNKADLFVVLDKFVQQAALLDNMYDALVIIRSIDQLKLRKLQ